MGLNDCTYLYQLQLNNVPLHRSKTFIKNLIMKILSLSPFKNHSKTLGLSQLVSTRIFIKVYRMNQGKEEDTERSTSSWSTMCKPTMKSRWAHKKTLWHQNLLKLILINDQRCSIKHRWSGQFSIPQHAQSLREKCDTPINTKLQFVIRFSLPPIKKLTRGHAPINRNLLPAKMNHYYHVNKRYEQNINWKAMWELYKHM